MLSLTKLSAVALLLASTLTLMLSPFCAADWIDPDTPEDAFSTQAFTVIPGVVPKSTAKKKKLKKGHTASPTGSSPRPSQSPTQIPSAFPTSTPDTHMLVFSEEFNTPGRSFADGSDPRWTALEKNDYTNDALHYYSASNAATNKDGELVITTDAADTDIIGEDEDDPKKKVRKTKHFKSAMLQTWNKFCFTGGIVEAKVQLPGSSNIGGLWPAFWLLGNLARHTYVGSSQHIWPWSSNVCTEKSFHAQSISACSEVAHYGMTKGIGRGSPEIDIFEVQPGNIKANSGIYLESSVGQPFMSASFQVAPGRPDMRPGGGYWPGPGQWYDGLVGGQNTSLNINFYGNYNHFKNDPNPAQSDYWSDAVSYNRQLDGSHFNSSHIYRLEWDVPTEDKDGYLHWFLDGKLVLAINGTGIRQGGTGSEISTEPMYILLNTAVSSQWGFPLTCPANCDCKEYDCNSREYSKRCGFSDGFCDMMTKQKTSPKYKVDWVRVYQDPSKEEQKVGCSTPERPTRRYIEAHEKLYKTDKDERPLKTIQVGRGSCDPAASTKESSPESCGGEERGQCTKGNVCECKEGWVGPHCLAAHGYDDIDWDPKDHLSDVGFIAPEFVSNFLLVGLTIVIVAILVAAKWRRQLLEGWTPIPDVDTKHLGV
jgi:beta-glucanase (GH16 family)